MQTLNLQTLSRQNVRFLPLICLFLSFLIPFPPLIHAQSYECGVYNKVTPDIYRYLDPVYLDRYGNQYAEEEMGLWNFNIQANHCDQIEDFTLIFENVQNNPFTQAEMETVCDVFTYLSQIILTQSGERAIIRLSKDPNLANDVGAIGTAFFPNQCGLGHSLVHQQFFTGGVNTPQHGLIAVNANLTNFYIGPEAGIGASELDFYTAILHEALHVLGFGSQITPSGAPNQGFYTLWDLNLADVEGHPMILTNMPSTNGSCCADYSFNHVDFPSMPDMIWSQDCGPTNIRFQVPQVPPVNGEYAGQDAQTFMNVLSHLDRTCGSDHYVMNSGIPPGTDGIQRTLTPTETTILCRLGYDVDNGCDPTCVAIAANDGTFFVGQGDDIQIDVATLLSNDFPTNATFTLLPNCGNTSGIDVDLNGNQITVQANDLGAYTFCYSITSCDGRRCDVATVRIVVTNPAIAVACENLEDCQINPFWDFEDFGSNEEMLANLTLGEFAGGTGFTFYKTATGGWDNTPDLVISPTAVPWTCGANSLSNIVTPNGDQLVRLVLRRPPGQNQSQGEGMAFPLCEPIFPGMSGTVTFVAMSPAGCLSFNPSIRVEFSESEPVENEIVYDIPGISSPSWFVPITSNQNTNPAFATYTVTFTNESSVCWNYLYLSSFTNIDLPAMTLGSIFVDAVRTELHNDLLDILDLTTSAGPAEPCLGGQVNVNIEICNNVECEGNTFTNPATLVTVQLPPGLTLVPNADFPSLTHLINEGDIPSGECIHLELTLQVADDEALIGQSLPINLQFTPLDPCYDGSTVNAGSVSPIDCTPELACPCTAANTLNIIAASTGSLYSVLEAQFNYDQNNDGVINQSDHHGCIAIFGKLIIDQNLTITDCPSILMQPCSEIEVQAHRNLTMIQNTIIGCERMWRGISVDAFGRLVFQRNEIQDAQHAITATGSFVNWPPPGGNNTTIIDVQRNRFIRNHVGVFVPGPSGSNLTQTPFAGNDFIGNGPTQLLPACDQGLANWNADNGYAGVVSQGVTFTVGASTDQGITNTFSRLRNGVIGENCWLQVHHASFTDLVGEWLSEAQIPTFASSTGIGVLTSAGFSTVGNSNFNGCGHGIYSRGGILAALENDMPSVRRGIELSNPFGFTLSENEDIVYRNRGIVARDLQTSVISQWLQYAINKNVLRNFDQTNTEGDLAIDVRNGNQPDLTNARMSENEIYLNTAESGILIRGVGRWTIDNNYVQYQPFNGTAPTGTGLALNTSPRNYLYSNTVLDNSSGAATRGFNTAISPQNIFCCNTTDGGRFGFRFFGGCGSTTFRTSEMNFHERALEISQTGIMGEQGIFIPFLGIFVNNRNFFNGSSGEALHFGTTNAVVQASRFHVLTQNTPDWPIQVVTQPGVTEPWFHDDGFFDYNCSVCEVPPAVPDVRGKEIDEADRILAGEGFSDGSQPLKTLQWEGSRSLYERMKRYPELHGLDDSVDRFYADNETRPIGNFYEADVLVNDLSLISATHEAAIALELQAIGSAETRYNAKLAELKDARTLADSLLIYGQAAEILRNVSENVSSMVESFQAVNDDRETRAQSALATIQALPQDDQLMTNRVEVLSIYAETIGQGNFSLSPSQAATINNIAHQCPDEGGSAVYLAQAIYQLVANEGFDDDELCGYGERGNKESGSKSFAGFGVEIIPNPASDEVAIVLPKDIKDGAIQIVLLSTSGQAVIEKNYPNNLGIVNLQLTNIPDGIYFCQVKAAGIGTSTHKLVVKH
ncbi:MAG: T9SS type A sorting domain-containing protein [Phycisphaerae bacterium]|nr:T9SS type A sorting domain-containing protein [Saprospiraceae bacterium]